MSSVPATHFLFFVLFVWSIRRIPVLSFRACGGGGFCYFVYPSVSATSLCTGPWRGIIVEVRSSTLRSIFAFALRVRADGPISGRVVVRLVPCSFAVLKQKHQGWPRGDCINLYWLSFRVITILENPFNALSGSSRSHLFWLRCASACAVQPGWWRVWSPYGVFAGGSSQVAVFHGRRHPFHDKGGVFAAKYSTVSERLCGGSLFPPHY